MFCRFCDSFSVMNITFTHVQEADFFRCSICCWSCALRVMKIHKLKGKLAGDRNMSGAIVTKNVRTLSNVSTCFTSQSAESHSMQGATKDVEFVMKLKINEIV